MLYSKLLQQQEEAARLAVLSSSEANMQERVMRYKILNEVLAVPSKILNGD
jgi:hypothetical protein